MKLKISKNILRKRTSTNAIKKNKESCKKAYKTIEKIAQNKIEIKIKINQETEVSIQEKINYSKVDKKSKEKKKQIERKTYQRVR